MKSSFNAFGQTKKVFGAPSVPVWLGVVGPVPVGGTLAPEFATKGAFYAAGTPVNLTDKVITPFVALKVKSYAAGDTNDVITVATNGILPSVNDAIMKFESFTKAGKAVAVVAVEETAEGAVITIAHETSALVATGDVITLAAAAGSSKAVKTVVNHYLYNDINLGDIEENAAASGACVRYHADGILIDRTPAAEIADACAVAIPGVLQVKG